MNSAKSRIRSSSTNKTEDKKGVLKQSKEKSKSGERSATKPRSLSKKSSQESLSGDENRKTHLSKKSSGKMNKTKSSKSTKRSSKSPKDSHPKTPNWIEDLSNQGMAIISITVFQKTHLKELIVSGNNLRSLPTAIKDLVNLEYLDVSKNPLKIRDSNDVNCFPLEMRYLYKLKRLNVSECNLRYIPSPIWLVPSIEHLDLSRNKLGLLVPEIGSLQNLQILNLSQCDLSTLPPEIGFCVELIEIILWGNQIESLPETLKECVKLRELKINYRSFLVNQIDTYVEDLIRKGKYTSEHIPPVVFDLVSLTILDLSGAKINALPENNLKNLMELHLGSNFFDKLPEKFFQSMMESLKVLKLDGNSLDQVPSEIKLLEKLEILNLDHNKLTTFPGHDDFNLMGLKELYISNNQLTQLTSSIGLLKSLKTLVLDCNRLTDLPESLYDLVDLEYLDLSYNVITKLSNSITKLKNLKCSHSYVKLNKTGLWLIGNPLELPPHKIWKTKTIEKIYNYLTTFYRRDVNYIRYAKLIFIGDSSVGKSIIIDCILNPLNMKKLQQQSVTLASSSVGMVKKSETFQRNSVMNRSNNYISTPLDMNTGTSFAQKMSLNEQYTPMSKSNSRLDNQLAHHNGKESIIPNLYVPMDNTDSLTKVARKLYIRTKDKYEFGIIDLAGEQTYHSLYPLFISTIDYTNQPTIFVLVYSHSEYTTALHDKFIGNWLKYIISFTNNDSDDSIQVKLVGIQSDPSDLDEEEFDVQINSIRETKKQNEIIENCYQTINLHKKQLLKEKNRLEDILKQNNHDEDNVINIEESLKLINKQLSKEINLINMEPLIIKSDTIQDDLKDLIDELQYETKKFNTFAPISFRDQLKKYVLKFDKNSYKIDLNDLMEKINKYKIDLFLDDDMLISELNDIFNHTERIVDYMATINDIFWFKMNPKYKNFIFHRAGYMLKSLQVVVAHDLDYKLDYNKTLLFNQIGLYQGEKEFLNDFKLLKTYGFMNNKMFDALWFWNDFDDNDESNVIHLLQDLLVGYFTEINVRDAKQPQVKFVLPNMCTNQFKKVEVVENKTPKNTIELGNIQIIGPNDEQPNDIVEIGKEENYFIKIEKIREYENIQKLIKAERKEKAIWNLNQLTYENEDEDKEKEINEQRRSALSAKFRESINIIPNKDKKREIIEEEEDDEEDAGEDNTWNDITTTSMSNHEYLHSIADEFKYIKSYRDVDIDQTSFNYKFKYQIELIFQIDIFDISNLFHKLSVLIQDYVIERLDSSDCIIARDVDNNFIKIELIKKLSTASELNNKITIDLKSIKIEHIENLKSIFNQLLDILFSYYPGISYLKQVSLNN